MTLLTGNVQEAERTAVSFPRISLSKRPAPIPDVIQRKLLVH